ncbi:MAG: alpha-amylase family glycosyl hydrolase [Candidatus Kapaibacterium sp.]|jgi:cyclomaltodextrinase
MKKIIILSICVICLSQLGLAASNNRIIAPIYLRNNIVDSIYVPDIVQDEDYEDYTVVAQDRMTMRYDKKTNMIYVTPSVEETALTVLTLKKGDIAYDIPVMITRTFRYTFTALPKSENPKAFLAGTFNNWSRTSLPMIPDQNGIPSLTMYLEPGRYFFKYLLDGEIVTDANLPIVADGRGGEMNMLNVISSNSSIVLLPLQYKKNTDGTIILPFSTEGVSSLQPENIIVFRNNTVLPKSTISINRNSFTITLPKEKNSGNNDIIRLGINSNGTSSMLYSCFIKNGEVSSLASTDDMLQNMSIYSILVDRFYDGTSENNDKKAPDSVIPYARYKGGDFTGIIKKIRDGYFTSLNVNTLLLSPVIDNPDGALPTSLTAPSTSSAFLGLWPIHHEKVENHFGTMEELQLLIKEAHKRGIFVVLDYIADQVHKDHPYFSSNPQWFIPYRGGDNFVRIIDFNSHPDAVDKVTDNIIWWLENTEADGVKIDNAGSINEQFRRSLAKKIRDLEKKSDKNIMVMGHIRDIPYLTPTIMSQGQMTTTLNAHIYEGIYATTLEKGNLDFLASALQSDKMCDYCLNYIDEPTGYYHPKIPAKRTLDFIPLPTAHQSDSITTLRRKFMSLPLYHVMTHTLPGIPVIHTGEEVGFSASVSTSNPNTMFFGDSLFYEEKEVLRDVRNITALRANHSALRNGTFNLVFQQGNWMLYIRADNKEKILVAINIGEYEASLSCQIPPEYNAKELVDIYTKNAQPIPVKNSSTAQIDVPAYGFRILQIQ